MRTADIVVGEHYLWNEHSWSHLVLVKVLETAVERPVKSSRPHYSSLGKAMRTRSDGVRIEVADPEDYRYGRKDELVLPGTIVIHIADPEQWLRERVEQAEAAQRLQREGEERRQRWREGESKCAVVILREAGIRRADVVVSSWQPEVKLSGEEFFRLVEHLEKQGEQKGWARARAKGGS